ncbi:hypothetical protein J3R30DRAFT_3703790 [Lentinula aciculospora]|uniref:Uncharacterized protein n=1 Tax=Lentinula aciculospora TaxID=153920 RepID=A0A9W9AC05_9AGAR|nr:hypothetical protein J3R30DRAFT_3703790 [Lentinula aciculospora]
MANKLWTTAKTWSLITEIKCAKNFKVLYGQAADENSSGDTKNAVHQCIAGKLFGKSDKLTTTCIKNHVTWLETTFKKKVKELKKTGEGVNEYYQILPTGPDHDTNPRAVTIWECINAKFPFFADVISMQAKSL